MKTGNNENTPAFSSETP